MFDLTLEKWDALSPSECETYARQLAKELPSGFVFQAVRPFHLGTQERLVATFRFGDSSFVLVPGGSVTLGFDENEWEPDEDEAQSWQGTADEYGIAESFDEYIAKVTIRPRVSNISPVLVETNAGEVGWQPMPPDDPEVKKLAKEHFRGNARQVTFSGGGQDLRVRRGDDGSISAERALANTHSDLSKQLGEDGFRFPTPEEWEYLCGAGSKTLFRWGDHAPCDRYPTDVSPEESAFRKEWVLSGGKLAYPPEGFTSDWNLHLRPNAFGIFIASYPYHSELTSEPHITRGGDGGCTICGGAGFFVGWITLATAYFEEHACERDPSETIETGYTIGRRVLPLV